MPDIKSWIRDQLKAGFSKDSIKKALKESGYDPDILDEVLKESLIRGQNNYNLMPKSSSKSLIIIAVVFLIVGGLVSFAVVSNAKNTRIGKLIDETEALKSQLLATPNLNYEVVSRQNLELAQYSKSKECKAGYGFIYGLPEAARSGKSRVDLLVFKDEIIGFLYTWPVGDGWLENADQAEGSPLNLKGGQFYTQTVYFKTPPTAEDCTSVSSQ